MATRTESGGHGWGRGSCQVNLKVMWAKAETVVGYGNSEAQGFADSWRAGDVSGSCWVNRSLPEKKECGKKHRSLRTDLSSHLGCPLKSLGGLKNTDFWVPSFHRDRFLGLHCGQSIKVSEITLSDSNAQPRLRTTIPG